MLESFAIIYLISNKIYTILLRYISLMFTASFHFYSLSSNDSSLLFRLHSRFTNYYQDLFLFWSFPLPFYFFHYKFCHLVLLLQENTIKLVIKNWKHLLPCSAANKVHVWDCFELGAVNNEGYAILLLSTETQG